MKGLTSNRKHTFLASLNLLAPPPVDVFTGCARRSGSQKGYGKKRFAAAAVVLVMVLCLAAPVKGAIPVHDYLKAVWDEISHKAKMLQLAKILEAIRTIKRIEQETREFFANIYTAIKESELVNAEEMIWIFMNSTFLKDILKKDPWWVVWNSETRLADIFPELKDFSYMKDNYLYKHRPEYRAYVDQTIAQMQEKVQDLENIRDHMALMRQSYIKNIKQLNLFSNRLYEFSKGNHVGKLIALLANLELMNARLNLQLNLNRRVQNTILLKEQVLNMANYNREANRKIMEWYDEK